MTAAAQMFLLRWTTTLAAKNLHICVQPLSKWGSYKPSLVTGDSLIVKLHEAKQNYMYILTSSLYVSAKQQVRWSHAFLQAAVRQQRSVCFEGRHTHTHTMAHNKPRYELRHLTDTTNATTGFNVTEGSCEMADEKTYHTNCGKMAVAAAGFSPVNIL